MISLSHLSSTNRKRKRRPRWKEVHHRICQGRFAIPRRSYRTLPPTRQVRHPNGSWSPGLPRCRPRVPLCRDSRTRRKRRSWQQEESYRSPTHYSRRKERWGTQPSSRRSYHCLWRCPSQHSRHSSSQEVQISTLCIQLYTCFSENAWLVRWWHTRKQCTNTGSLYKQNKPEILISTFSKTDPIHSHRILRDCATPSCLRNSFVWRRDNQFLDVVCPRFGREFVSTHLYLAPRTPPKTLCKNVSYQMNTTTIHCYRGNVTFSCFILVVRYNLVISLPKICRRVQSFSTINRFLQETCLLM